MERLDDLGGAIGAEGSHQRCGGPCVGGVDSAYGSPSSARRGSQRTRPPLSQPTPDVRPGIGCVIRHRSHRSLGRSPGSLTRRRRDAGRFGDLGGLESLDKKPRSSSRSNSGRPTLAVDGKDPGTLCRRTDGSWSQRLSSPSSSSCCWSCTPVEMVAGERAVGVTDRGCVFPPRLTEGSSPVLVV